MNATVNSALQDRRNPSGTLPLQAITPFLWLDCRRGCEETGLIGSTMLAGVELASLVVFAPPGWKSSQRLPVLGAEAISASWYRKFQTKVSAVCAARWEC